MLTIIVPTIGRSNTIFRAMASACAVTNEVVKQIVVVDNSQDETFSNFLQRLIGELNDARLSVHTYSEHQTMGNSWNLALEQVTQPWVLYLHDDDEVISAAFNLLLCLDVDNFGVIAFDYFVDFQKNNKHKRIIVERLIKKGTTKYQSIIQNCPKLVSTVINMNALRNIGGWNDRYGYFLDLVAFLEIAKNNDVKFISYALGIYYKHMDNESSLVKRATHYGDAIPVVVEKLFQILKDEKERRELMLLFYRFVYPYPIKGILDRIVLRTSAALIRRFISRER